MIKVLFFLWQLPQNILGLILLFYYKDEKIFHEFRGRRFYYTKEMCSGISLGNYIVLKRKDNEDGIKHEYGHSIQSRILGPLYLLLIGLPSLLGNIYCFYYQKGSQWYYNQPWEHWADKLGGVQRY